jgi:PKD repeat protein
MYNSGSVNIAAVEHTFTQPGTYAVLLGLTLPESDAEYVWIEQVSVSPPRPLDFTVRPSQGPSPLAVTATYSDYEFLDATTVDIDFGDGTVLRGLSGANDQSVKRTKADHVYTAPGTYTVLVTVRTPSLSLERTASEQVIVTAAQSNDFTASVINSSGRPLTVTYLWTSADQYCFGGIAPCKGVTWDYGDGTSEVDAPARPHHTYARAGTYTVRFSYFGILTKTKQFELAANGTITEVQPVPVPAAVKPTLSQVVVNGTPAASQTGLSVQEGLPITVSGTGTPGSTIVLTTFSAPVTTEVVVAGNGTWSYTLPPLDPGDHRIEAGLKGSPAPSQVLLRFTVTTKPTAAVPDKPAPSSPAAPSSGVTDRAPTSSNQPSGQLANQVSSASSAAPSEEKKSVVVQDNTKSQTVKRLVSAGSNLPFMLGFSLVLAALGSFLWIKRADQAE